MQHDLNTQDIQYDSIVGVIGGTLLGISHLVPFTNIISTILLSLIGATVSFFATQFFRWIISKINGRKTKSKNKFKNTK